MTGIPQPTDHRNRRLLSLLLAICFLPFGILGNNLHSVVHQPHGCTNHSVAADLLSWFDSSNQLLEQTLLSVERSFKKQSSTDDVATANSLAGFGGQTEVTNLSPEVSTALTFVHSPQYQQRWDIAADPARAGPVVKGDHKGCDGHCHLCLSLRQLHFTSTTTFLHVAPVLVGNHCTDQTVSFCTTPLWRILSRGPPSLS